MYMRTSLGMIPSWQFSTDPAVNYHINPYVQFPPGVDQQTIQPLGPNMQPGVSGVFDSPVWQNRQWFAAGAVAIAGLALVGGLAVLLK